MKTLNIILVAMIATTAAAQTTVPKMKKTLDYPKAPTSCTVDNYFGIKLADPFRPLENDTAAATLEWVAKENAVTREYIDAVPFRNDIAARLKQIFDYPRVGTPFKGSDGRYYVYENDGLRNQSVLYTMKTPKGKRTEFFDPNKLSKDGTVALKSLVLSPDGKLTAYSVSRNGSDWEEMRVMDTKTRRNLPDLVEWTKFSSPEWSGNGFFYSAYPKPADGQELSAANEGHNVYYHRIGTSQDADILVYADAEHPFHFHNAQAPRGSGLLFITGSGEGLGNSLAMHRLNADGSLDENSEWVTMVDNQEIAHDVMGVIDGKIYIHTALGAPNSRIMVADVDNPAIDAWREIVPETDAVLAQVGFAGDRLVLGYERDALTEILLADLDGNITGRVDLPGPGTATVSSNRKSGDEIFYRFESYTDPGTIFRADLAKGTTEVLSTTELKGINTADYVTEQVFYTSKDGTRIPMYITHHKDVKPDGHNPTLLYGYGGFNISMTPYFSPSRLFWLENGGVYVVANIRGGAEYGDKWHEAGTKLNKQNVFDDFIAAAEYLIDNGWTTPAELVVNGGSNGGLLIGAVTNQRPDLFAVAIPQVGVMDMMRYHLFTIGWNWASDYGRSDDNPEMAKYLLGYSPLHNIRTDGTRYPAILVTTADHDDRVVPAHSFKYAATLQEANTGPEPKLIRIDSNAGHGGGKPVSKSIDEWADIYAFIFSVLEREPR